MKFSLKYIKGTRIEDFVRRLLNRRAGLDRFAAQAAGRMARRVAERAVVNAPIWTGALRKSGFIVEKVGKTAYVVRLRDIEYMHTMHKHLHPHEEGPSPKGRIYNLGPISRKQPTTPEGGVGGTFLYRAGDFVAKTEGKKFFPRHVAKYMKDGVIFSPI